MLIWFFIRKTAMYLCFYNFSSKVKNVIPFSINYIWIRKLLVFYIFFLICIYIFLNFYNSHICLSVRNIDIFH